jgi:HlyD family secretion protein
MSTNQATTDKPRSRRRAWMAAAVGAVVVAAVVLLVLAPGVSSRAAAEVPVFTVRSQPLTISVTATGSIRNADAAVVRNEVEGQSTILFIVDEGTFVQEGDLLVELDSSKLQDNRVDQEIKVRNDEASYINAKEAMTITEKQGQSIVKTAEVALELAILDLEKYIGVSVRKLLGLDVQTQATLSLADIADRLSKISLASIDLGAAGQNEGEGEYSQALKQAENKITITQEELSRARTKYEGSEKLHAKGYISKTELDADRLELTRRQLELDVARKDRELLERYTKRRTVAELLSEVDQRAFSLLKAQHEADSNLRDAEATYSARKLAYEREQGKLEKLIDQIAKCKRYAPQAGMVVYGTKRSRYDEPLKQGMTVYERQELIRIPKPGGMIAEVKIHESMVEKVREGLPALVTFDAMADRRFNGTVRRVALVPDEEDRWVNPDAKSYKTEVAIEANEGAVLKPGMSCTVEIVIHHYDDTLFVPVQAVLRVDGEPTVYVARDKGQPEQRVVAVGLDNNRMICIASGLAVGERVLLNPPLPAAEKPQSAPISAAIAEAANAIPSGPQLRGRPTGSEPAASVQSPAAEAPRAGPVPATAEGARAGGLGSLTAEQQAQMRERFLASLPEEYREKVQSMTQDERRAWFQSEEGRQVMQQLRGGGGLPAPSRRDEAAPPAAATAEPSIPAAGS